MKKKSVGLLLFTLFMFAVCVQIFADCDFYVYRHRNPRAYLYKKYYTYKKRKEKSEAVKSKICGVKILNAEFYKQYASDTLPISTARITVQNRSKYSVTKIYFKGKITTHITNTILIEDVFNFDLPVPLEPKKQEVYDISLNSFGKWSKVNPPDLAKFDVELIGIETADGEDFIQSFSLEDQKKLDNLKKKMNQGKKKINIT